PIPYGRPYFYHPNGPVYMMTARKRVGPLPTHRLAVRHSVDYSSSDHFTSDDLSRDSPSDSSSETSSDSSSDALSDSSSGHSSLDHSSPALPSALSSVRADLLPPCKRIRSSDSVTDLEDCSDESSESSIRETSLRDDVDVRGSDEPYSELDIDPEIQAEINECIAYADALRAEGIDARVVVETVAREEVETSARGTVEVRVDRVTHPVVSDDIPEPTEEEGAIERDQGNRIVATGQQSAVQSKRISELERDNTRLRGILDVASQRVTVTSVREEEETPKGVFAFGLAANSKGCVWLAIRQPRFCQSFYNINSGMRSSHQLCSSVPSIPHSSTTITERPSHSSYVGPSRKRSRSLTTSVPVSSHVPGALSSIHANLLPPCKRIRSSDSVTDLEDCLDESLESSIPKETSLRNDVVVRGIEWIDARVVVEIVAQEEVEMSASGTVEVRVDRVTHRIFHDHTMEIPVYRVQVIESIQRDQGHRIVAMGQQSVVQSERISELEWDNMRLRGMLDVASQRGGENGDDYEGGNGGGNRNGNKNGGVNGNRNGGGNGNGNDNGNGNGNRGGNGYENHNMNLRGFMPVARETIEIDVAYAMTWT
ncbi:hypothetical protein Tco_0883984, partial [Tanacetum coccineum]